MENRMFIQDAEGSLLNLKQVRLMFIACLDAQNKMYGVKAKSKEATSVLYTGEIVACEKYMNELYSKLSLEMSTDTLYPTSTLDPTKSWSADSGDDRDDVINEIIFTLEEDDNA